MQNATERRQMILEKLSDCRRTTRDALAKEFNVSTRTIERDIEILSCSAPIFTLQGVSGEIYVADAGISAAVIFIRNRKNYFAD